jgi:hypothetical protein
MKSPDVDKLRSEENHTLEEFVALYNENLPDTFPHASNTLLKEFRKSHASFFKLPDTWSLEQHRKRVMDWLQLATIYKQHKKQ